MTVMTASRLGSSIELLREASPEHSLHERGLWPSTAAPSNTRSIRRKSDPHDVPTIQRLLLNHHEPVDSTELNLGSGRPRFSESCEDFI